MRAISAVVLASVVGFGAYSAFEPSNALVAQRPSVKIAEEARATELAITSVASSAEADERDMGDILRAKAWGVAYVGQAEFEDGERGREMRQFAQR